MLRVESPPETRIAINSLLIEEENKLSRNLEQLEYVELRAARLRANYQRMSCLREHFPEGSAERSCASRLLLDFETTLKIVDSICMRMRKQVNEGAL